MILTRHVIVLRGTEQAIHVMPLSKLRLARRQETARATVLDALAIPLTALAPFPSRLFTARLLGLVLFLLLRLLCPCLDRDVLRNQHVTMLANTVRCLVVRIPAINGILTT